MLPGDAPHATRITTGTAAGAWYAMHGAAREALDTHPRPESRRQGQSNLCDHRRARHPRHRRGSGAACDVTCGTARPMHRAKDALLTGNWPPIMRAPPHGLGRRAGFPQGRSDVKLARHTSRSPPRPLRQAVRHLRWILCSFPRPPALQVRPAICLRGVGRAQPSLPSTPIHARYIAGMTRCLTSPGPMAAYRPPSPGAASVLPSSSSSLSS